MVQNPEASRNATNHCVTTSPVPNTLIKHGSFCFHCHAINTAQKRKNWKPSSGRRQENEMLQKTVYKQFVQVSGLCGPQFTSYLPKHFTHHFRDLYTNMAAENQQKHLEFTFSIKHRRSQYEANRGTRLGKILPNTVDFYFFYQTDNIRRFHTADFVQRTVCSPRL